MRVWQNWPWSWRYTTWHGPGTCPKWNVTHSNQINARSLHVDQDPAGLSPHWPLPGHARIVTLGLDGTRRELCQYIPELTVGTQYETDLGSNHEETQCANCEDVKGEMRGGGERLTMEGGR